MRIVAFPAYFEVRWTEYVHQLLNAVWINLPAVLTQLKQSCDNDARAFAHKWTEVGRLRLLVITIDVLWLLSRMQVALQRDTCTVFDINREAALLRDNLSSLKSDALVGGDEEKFNKLLCQQTTANGQVYHFQGHQLWQKFRRSNKHNAFVTDQRDVSAIRVELVMSLLNFMSERLPETEFSTLQPLQKLNANISDDELRRCHSALLSDMPLKDFVCAYKEAAKSIEQQDLTVRQLLVKTLKNQQWKCLSIALARVIAAKPHSADVERLISSYNCLKTNVGYVHLCLATVCMLTCTSAKTCHLWQTGIRGHLCMHGCMKRIVDQIRHIH